MTYLLKMTNKKWMMVALLFTIGISTLTFFSEDVASASSESMVDTEVKFLLEPTLVLDEDGQLSSSFLETLDLTVNRQRRIDMQFMDTLEQDFNDQGWIHRIRQRNWQNNWQLTYRKRFPLAWPVTEGSIQAALKTAENEGFTEEDWEFEIDWSYDSAVLSTSSTKTVDLPLGVRPGDLPDTSLARRLLIDNQPALVPVIDYNQLINQTLIHGPVYFDRYEFSVPELGGSNALRIEVLPIKTEDGQGIEYIVEASFVGENQELAATEKQRDYLFARLSTMDDLVVPKSGLRTSTILQRYKHTQNV
ncbi:MULTISPECIES: hypothetical protein [unclassified Enterococcus]|uniref:hypothetical protein n=1 Tax=unclassified Enterococcus TaxID=2608891 RepID=UPI001A9B1C02|nr:hypothetical protein [Enterococcus sp. DIV1271a]MBO1299853.1 hypothetical protein [Enterococcus sp. DIV1271a]